jgi:DNA modification methylase
MYKTISYPSPESGTGKIERLRISISSDKTEFSKWLAGLSSKEIRALLSRNYSQLQQDSISLQLPLSQVTTELLLKLFNEESKINLANEMKAKKQLGLFEMNTPLGRHGTFTPNHIESIHRWYPYIEGFSSTFVRNLISKWGNGAKSIYDPFGGTGTTMAVGSMMGLQGFYSEINPFMRHVIEGKTNVLRRVAANKEDLSHYFENLLNFAKNNLAKSSEAEAELESAFSNRPYFKRERLIQILSIRNAIRNFQCDNSDFRHLAILALGSIAVQCSELKRAADLRYRTEKESLPENFCVFGCYQGKTHSILDDIEPCWSDAQEVECIGEDALGSVIAAQSVDFILTSPPYLNGTNYFRNTKIELWLSDLIASEKDLGYFTRRAVTAGINNVSKNGRAIKKFDFVEPIATKLDEVAYDKRIPELVRRYCSDADIWLRNCFDLLVPGGRAVIDIGDSRFAGVHVPADIFLERIAVAIGFKIQGTELVRKRTSKDGTPLSQVLLILEKPSQESLFNFGAQQ